MVRNILVPIMTVLLRDCPEDLRPTWKKMEGLWLYPNGSQLYMAGCNNDGADNLRGMASDLFIFDEAGYIDHLNYIVADIALPQTLTTGGHIVLSSSPPKHPTHEFNELAAECEASGNYIHRTIWQSTLGYDTSIPEQKRARLALIREYIDESKGEDSITWRREYLAEDVLDEKNSIIPEWINNQIYIVDHDHLWTMPDHYDSYTVMDLGFNPDFTFVVFAVYDFLNAKPVVIDEICQQKMVTDDLAEQIIIKENKWFNLHQDFFSDGQLISKHEREKIVKVNRRRPQPYGRWTDLDTRVQYDLSVVHGLDFANINRAPKEVGVNTLRVAVCDHDFIILPRCKQLRNHLKLGLWDNLHRDYLRLPGLGHFDGIDALIYLLQNLDRAHNPYPNRIPDEERQFIRPGARYKSQSLLSRLTTPKTGYA
jgi:hypothetical protein